MKKTLLEWIKHWEANGKKSTTLKRNDKTLVISNHSIWFHGKEMSALDLDREYELVEEPVPFLDAVKAFDKGKTIKCDLKGDISVYKPENRMLIEFNTIHVAISTREILEGKWYIEE